MRDIKRGRLVQILGEFVTSVVLTLGLVGLASGDWSDNFDGGLQQPWQFVNFNDIFEPSATFSASSVGDRLVVTDPTIAFDGGAATAFGFVPEPFSDVMVTGVLNPDNSQFMNDSLFLFARGDLATSTSYTAELQYSSQQLLIYRSDGLGFGSNLAQEVIPNFQFSDSFYVEFEVVGPELTARAYDAPGGTLRQMVTATDSTYTEPGVSGFILDFEDAFLPLLGVFDDITATAILPSGDFNDDGAFDCDDVDPLVADIAAGLNSLEFDITLDGLVNTDDLNEWLSQAGEANLGENRSYLLGDATLDGLVDGQDFLTWNVNKFTPTAAWCAGDFTADGTIDGQDFLAWNENKFQQADAGVVPEPSSCCLLFAAGLAFIFRFKSQS